MARTLWALALAVVGVFTPNPALAFDTGHHFDLTQAVLKDAGFTAAAVHSTQVSNWVADYFNTPVSPDRGLVTHFELLHFDDLATDDAVRARWASLVRNTRASAVAAAVADDPERLLTVLGLSLHAVQDFYSHSNWVEAHPRVRQTPFRTETYFTGKPSRVLFTSAQPHTALLPSLAHGDYFTGMNKDSFVRAGWREAYIFADVASREWVRAVAGWAEEARPGAWQAARNWKPSPQVAHDLRHQVVTARRLSSWGSFGYVGALGITRQIVPTGSDGHWKGNGSGSFFGTLLASLHGPGPRASMVSARAIAVVPELVAGMGSQEVLNATGLELEPEALLVSLAETPGGALRHAMTPSGGAVRRMVSVRTLSVRARVLGLDAVSRPDFYAKVTVNGQLFIEAPQVDRQESKPFWTALALTPVTTKRVPIRYALWDQDYPKPDDPVDLAGGKPGPVSFWFEPETGQVGGLPPTMRLESRLPNGRGAILVVRGQEAEVRLRVTTQTLLPSRSLAPLDMHKAGI